MATFVKIASGAKIEISNFTKREMQPVRKLAPKIKLKKKKNKNRINKQKSGEKQ